MRHYEIVVLMRSGESERNKIAAERYQKIVADKGGKTHRFEDWGNRHLAYPIQRQSLGHYFLFNVECGQDALSELKENLRFSEVVVRFLIIRRENAITDASPIAKDAEKGDDAESAKRKDAKTEATEKPDDGAKPATSGDDEESADAAAKEDK